jgi:hypothetical protein
MGFLDRLRGEREWTPRRVEPGNGTVGDAQALERYRYLLRTAPPDAIEQAHAEAFAQLTPEQRAQVLRDLSEALAPGERAAERGHDDPKSLARMATRAEVRQPGSLERAFGGRGMGGMMGGSLLNSVAGAFIGSAIAHQLFGGFGDASPVESGATRSDDESESGSGDEAQDDQGDFGDDVGDFGD